MLSGRKRADSEPELASGRIFNKNFRPRQCSQWQWQLLRMYSKATIATVNGWCFGDAFSPQVACDLAIAADDAVFGLSEINWGIPPGNLVPKDQLRETVIALANTLLEKYPVVLRYAKQGFKRARELTWEQGEDYLHAKTDQSNYRDPEKGRKEGLKQFLDDKTIKPGLQTYKRS